MIRDSCLVIRENLLAGLGVALLGVAAGRGETMFRDSCRVSRENLLAGLGIALLGVAGGTGKNHVA